MGSSVSLSSVRRYDIFDISKGQMNVSGFSPPRSAFIRSTTAPRLRSLPPYMPEEFFVRRRRKSAKLSPYSAFRRFICSAAFFAITSSPSSFGSRQSQKSPSMPKRRPLCSFRSQNSSRRSKIPSSLSPPNSRVVITTSVSRSHGSFSGDRRSGGVVFTIREKTKSPREYTASKTGSTANSDSQPHIRNEKAETATARTVVSR